MTNPHVQRDRARQMRREPTDAEYKLWFYLRAEQLGVKFRRQLPLGNYIVDFICLPGKLIVELDGGQHTLQRDYDEERTRWLNTQGFQVLRFWNCDVLEDAETVIDVIWRALGEPRRQPVPPLEAPPSPTLPAEGREEEKGTTELLRPSFLFSPLGLVLSPRRGGLGRGEDQPTNSPSSATFSLHAFLDEAQT